MLKYHNASQVWLHVLVSVDTCLHAFSLRTSTLQIKEEKNAARTTLETLPLTKDSEKYMLSEMDLRQYESPTCFNQIEKGKFVMKTRK